MIKKLLFTALFFPLFVFVGLKMAGYFLNDRFHISHVLTSLPSEGGGHEAKSEVQQALAQKFHYLGHGSQAFVFESEDGKTILKLINFRRLRLPSWLIKLPYPSFMNEIRNHRVAKKRMKQKKIAKSLSLADRELKKECALVYTHLKKTSHLNTQVTIADKLQRNYLIDADTTAFILQKKGELLYPYLLKLINEQKMNEAKQSLEKLIRLLISRMQKGIDDHDPFLAKNAGFADGEPLFLDVGQFAKNNRLQKSNVSQEQLFVLTRRLSSWLKKHSPELGLWLDKTIENI